MNTFMLHHRTYVHISLHQYSVSERMMAAVTHRRRLDRSLLDIGPLLTLQAGRQLLVSAVCHLLDQIQTLLHLEEHTHIRNVLQSQHTPNTVLR